MAVPASALSILGDSASDGLAVAALVFLAIVGMYALKLVRRQTVEDGPYTDSRGNEYYTQEDRDEAEWLMGPLSDDWLDEPEDYKEGTFDLEGAMKETEWREATGWREDESGRYRVVD